MQTGSVNPAQPSSLKERKKDIAIISLTFGVTQSKQGLLLLWYIQRKQHSDCIKYSLSLCQVVSGSCTVIDYTTCSSVVRV